jgi:beta-glucosidase
MRACPPKTPDEGECGHGVAGDGPSAAALALNAGMDSEMTSTLIRDYGKQLLASGAISMRRIDDAVRRILRVKFRAGLFEHPYAPFTPDQTEAEMLKPDARAAARKAAGESMVLLKNDSTLPFDPSKKTAVIGPLGDNGHDMLGPWWGRGDEKDAVTVFKGVGDRSAGATFTQACTLSHDEPRTENPEGCGAEAGDFSDAVAAANAADQVIVTVGETREMSGEAASRSNIDLPGRQEELIKKIHDTGKPMVVVVFSGRPLALENIVADSPAILQAWFPGVEAGNAVADVVFGDVNPGGKLPVSFPYRVGQTPIYYNHEPTGRPCNADSKYNSRYRDLNSCDPLFPFGFGLSYTTFDVSGLDLSSPTVSRNGSLKASVTVTNTGSRAGDDVVQLYIHDPVASISQPVRRLRGFERVTLQPNESKTVTFTLDKSDFGFWDNRGRFVVEPGQIDVYAGDSSKADLTRSFTVSG